MEALQNLLNEVIKKTDALKTAQALYSRQLAPKFSTFDYINTNELGLSRILADLLNPKGNHGQQEAFLKLFIDHCLPAINQAANWKNFVEHIEKTDVLVEELTWKSGTSRRMDVYLQCRADGKRYGICIENKPYASDQFEQLKDYAIELDNRKLDHWHIVYLNEYSDMPSKDSIDPEKLDQLVKVNRFSVLKFSDLIDWLQACQVKCQNYSVTEFLVQLIKFIQKQFMGIEDMNIENTVLEVMLQNDESIEASIQIANNVDAMKKQLIQRLKTDLRSQCQNKEYILDFDNIGKGENCEYFGFKMRDDDIGFISLEFATGFNNPVLGVRFYIDDTQNLDNQSYATEVKRIFDKYFTNKKVISRKWWPAYYEFYPFDWKNSGEPWYQIETGAMAIKIVEEVDEIYKILNDENLISEKL